MQKKEIPQPARFLHQKATLPPCQPDLPVIVNKRLLLQIQIFHLFEATTKSYVLTTENQHAQLSLAPLL